MDITGQSSPPLAAVNKAVVRTVWTDTATRCSGPEPQRAAIDLNPSQASQSQVNGVGGGMQVGYADLSTLAQLHAMLWSGSAASAIDLHPLSGFNGSEALAIGDGEEVGWAIDTGVTSYNAMVWSGTAASAVNLQQFLPSSYIGSQSARHRLQW